MRSGNAQKTWTRPMSRQRYDCQLWSSHYTRHVRSEWTSDHCAHLGQRSKRRRTSYLTKDWDRSFARSLSLATKSQSALSKSEAQSLIDASRRTEMKPAGAHFT